MAKTEKRVRTVRIDRLLVHMGVGSRSEVQKMIRRGIVLYGGSIIQDPGFLLDPEDAVFEVASKRYVYQEFYYFMMNKPAGLISASRGESAVLELLSASDDRDDLFLVGRLDKDSEGLLLMCNDGPLAHRLISPRYGIKKRYLVTYSGVVQPEDIATFNEGMVLPQGEICLPAELIVHEQDAQTGKAEVVLHEGKFHQVKRMMAHIGCPVGFLKRIAFGPLTLDENLHAGDYRALYKEEVAALYEATTTR